MLLKRRHILNPKKEILRHIFYDNQKMAGKCTDEDLARFKWERWYRHIRHLTMILIVAAVCLFPEISLDEELATAVVAEPVEVPEPAPPPAVVAKNEGPAQVVDARTAMWDDYAVDIRNILDYSLLLSRQDHVRLSALFGLDIKTIVIDPGHGGRDPGAIGARGTREKDIVLDVSLRLREKLLAKGQDVLLTRETDRKLSLAERVEFAKRNKADIFISVHVNSLPDQTLNIIETYFFGPPLNSETLWLAEQENKESHYTIGELDAIIQDIGNTLKRQESAMLAASIQESLFRNVRNHDHQVLDKGIKMAPFVVLSQIDVPSVLVEISCLTKVEEEEKLASASYREKIASFIEEGIIRYMEQQHTKTITGEMQ